MRRQFHLREDLDQQIQYKAREAGLSEDDLIQLALERFFQTEQTEQASQSDRAQALHAFLREAQHIASQHQLPEDWHFNRESLYSLEDRWQRGPRTTSRLSKESKTSSQSGLSV